MTVGRSNAERPTGARRASEQGGTGCSRWYVRQMIDAANIDGGLG